MEMRVLSVINLKGGVAKTISSVAIAHLLAERASASCWWTMTSKGTLPEDTAAGMKTGPGLMKS